MGAANTPTMSNSEGTDEIVRTFGAIPALTVSGWIAWRTSQCTPLSSLWPLLPARSSRRGDTVLDSFGGSGTTLIACERTGRKARLIDVDPAYCDQTVRRWQKLTGGIAVNATGVPFNDFEKS
jgi:predicted methyltransferase